MATSTPLLSIPSACEGYWAQLGIPETGAALLECVQVGFEFAVLKRLAVVSGFSPRELVTMAGLSAYTLRQCRKSGRFSMACSDHLYRIMRVLGAAQMLFEGDRKSAKAWLETPQWGLGGRRPIELVSTEVGAGVVCDLLGRIEHGVLP